MKHIIKGNKEDVVEAISNCVIGFKAKRNREIIMDRYLDGMTFEEIAEKHGLSVRHTKKIYYDQVKIISDYLACKNAL